MAKAEPEKPVKKAPSTKKSKAVKESVKESEKASEKKSAGKDLASKTKEKVSKAKAEKVPKVSQESKAIKKKPASAPKLKR